MSQPELDNPDSLVSSPDSNHNEESPRSSLVLTLEVIWFCVTVLSITTFILAIPRYYEVLLIEALQPEAQPAMIMLSASPEIYAFFLTLRDVIVTSFFLVTGLLLFYRRHHDVMVYVASITLITSGLGMTQILSTYPEGILFILTEVTLVLGYSFLAVFLFIFPDGMFKIKYSKHILILVIGISAIVRFVFYLGPAITLLTQISLVGILIAGVLIQIHCYRYLYNSIQKQQTRWIIVAFIIFIASVVLLILSEIAVYNILGEDIGNVFYNLIVTSSIGALPVLLLPLVIGFSVLRYRLWDLGVLLSRGLIYMTAVNILAASLAALIVLLQRVSVFVFNQETGSAFIVAGMLTVALVRPVVSLLQSLVNRVILRERRNISDAVRDLSNEIRSIVDLDLLTTRLVDRITDIFFVSACTIFLTNPTGELRSEQTFTYSGIENPLLSLDNKTRSDLIEGKIVHLQENDVYVLLFPLVTPSVSHPDLIGILAIGPRMSGAGYSTEILEVLRDLVVQAGTAIYVARVGSQLQTSRERAMLFLDVLSHDVRNYLQVIRAGSEILQEDTDQTTRLRILKEMEEAASRCERIIAKVKSTELLASTPIYLIDISEVLTEVLIRFTSVHPDVHFDTKILVAESMIEADEFLDLMISNLLDNAVQHNPKEEKKVWISLIDEEDAYLLSVEDNGAGIPNERKDRLFDLSRRFGGVGLHIVKEIVDKYEGVIEVIDRVPGAPENGVEFRIWLPK